MKATRRQDHAVRFEPLRTREDTHLAWDAARLSVVGQGSSQLALNAETGSDLSVCDAADVPTEEPVRFDTGGKCC